MIVNIGAFGSAPFWTVLAGAASTICGALGYAHEGVAVNAVLIAIGGILVGIVGHHTTAAAVARKAPVTVMPVTPVA
jgi:hypothetical protein